MKDYEHHCESQGYLSFPQFRDGLQYCSQHTGRPYLSRPVSLQKSARICHCQLIIYAALVGLISDRIQSRKSPLILGYIAIAVSTSVFLFGHSPPLLIVARVCQGFSGAVVGVLSFAIVADTAPPEKRGEYMAFVSVSYTWGMISGPVLGGLLYACHPIAHSLQRFAHKNAVMITLVCMGLSRFRLSC